MNPDSREECRALIQHYATCIRDSMKGYSNMDPKAQQVCWENMQSHAKRILGLASQRVKLEAEVSEKEAKA